MASRRVAGRLFGVCGVVLSALLLPAVSAAQTTALFIDSEPGDYVGQGARTTYTPEWAAFSVQRAYTNGISVFVTGPNYSFQWRVTFGGPRDAILAPGTYESARYSYPPTTLPLMEVSSGRYCSSLEGRFVVLEAVYASDGRVLQFAADFEQHCNGANPALFGAIRYNSSISTLTPFGGNYPSYRMTITPSPFGSVTGSGLDCGAGGVACETTFSAPALVTVSAAPSPGYVFMGWKGSCGGDETAIVNVNGPKVCAAVFEPAASGVRHTRLLIDSQPGDPVGLGSRRIYSSDNSLWSVFAYSPGSQLYITVHGDDGHEWRMELHAPAGSTLAAGVYNGAHSPYRDTFGPKLSVQGDYWCSDSTGRFVIHELVYNLNGTISALSVDFEQHCQNRSDGLFGAIRYNTTREDLSPFGGAYPSYSLTVAVPLHGKVVGGGMDCGSGATTCSITPSHDAAIELTAIPDAGYLFVGWSGDCSGTALSRVVVTGVKHCTATFEPVTASAPRTLLLIKSEAGDTVGGGKQFAFSSATTRWVTSGSASSSVRFEIHTTGAKWSVELGTPSGMPLTVGNYLGVGPYRTVQPWLDVRHGSSSCSFVTGRFVIHELEAGPGGTLTRFAADFEQHCNDAVPSLFGAIRYNSTLSEIEPFGGTFPTYRLTVSSSPNGRVSGLGIDCGAGATTCVATYGNPTHVVLSAVPQPGFVFLGWSGNCFGLETTTVRVYGPKECSAIFGTVTPATARTFMRLDSRPGDFVGGGARYIYAASNAAWNVSVPYSNVLRFRLDGVDGSIWHAEFGAAYGAVLQPGTYWNARRPTFDRISPALSITVSDRGCNVVTGHFVVHDIAFGTTGTLLRFAADFEQHCNDADPALFGVIRYNSLAAGVEAFGSASPAYKFEVMPSAHGRVTGGGIDCGSGASICSLVFNTPTSVSLTATPSPGYMFSGWAGACRGGQTTEIRIHGRQSCTATFERHVPTQARTVVVLDSAAGDYVGDGKRWVYGTGNALITPQATGGTNGVYFTVLDADDVEWELEFNAPIGGTLLPGTYTNAHHASVRTTTPGLHVRRTGRYCGEVHGRFIVRELVFGTGGVVDRAAIDFVQHCGAETVPPLIGSLRYRSVLPVALPGRTYNPILLGHAASTTNGGSLRRRATRDDDYSQASALQLPWAAYNAISGEVHPAFGDLDGDGKDELVLGLGVGGGGFIAVLDDETTGYKLLTWLRVRWEAYNQSSGAVYPAVGDLDGDGEAEIVAGLGAGGGGWLEVFGSASKSYGHERWLRVGYGAYAAANGETHPAVGDLDGNGAAEIVVGLGDGAGGWLEVFSDAYGQHLHKEWLRIGWTAFTTRSGATWPAVGDVDGDATPEIVVGLGQGGEGWLQVFSTSSAALPHREWLRVNWPDYNASCGETRPAVGNLGTAGPGVVVGLGSCASVTAGWITILETAHPNKPTVWRNAADDIFKASGRGLFPAVTPR